MENKTYIVQGDYLILKPEVEKPTRQYEEDNKLWNYFVKKEREEWYAILSSQPRIKRADGGLWKEGQEVVEGKDFQANWWRDTEEYLAIPINTNQQ